MFLPTNKRSILLYAVISKAVILFLSAAISVQLWAYYVAKVKVFKKLLAIDTRKFAPAANYVKC